MYNIINSHQEQLGNVNEVAVTVAAHYTIEQTKIDNEMLKMFKDVVTEEDLNT